MFFSLGDSELNTALREVSSQEIKRTIEDLVAFKNRNTNGETGKPSDTGISGARTYLRQKLEGYAAASNGRMRVSEDWFEASGKRIKTPLKVANVVATLVGSSDPERLYVVGGHYDSMNGDHFDAVGFAPGANDDASGTAVVVELARVLSRRSFDATILFVCYVGEEQGLLGSKHHASLLKTSNAFVDGMITNDIVGGSKGGNGVEDDRTIRVFSPCPVGNDSAARQFARAVAELASQNLKDCEVSLVFRPDRFKRGGDHLPFDENGFPAIRFTEANEDYRHQHQNVRKEGEVQFGDLPEFVNFDYVAKVARLNLLTLASFASAPRAPEKVEVKGAVAYETTLSWDDAPSIEKVRGYEVVWRKTTEPTWTGVKEVGNVNQAVLPIILDQYIVGVRAIGEKGHRSRVSTPAGI